MIRRLARTFVVVSTLAPTFLACDDSSPSEPWTLDSRVASDDTGEDADGSGVRDGRGLETSPNCVPWTRVDEPWTDPDGDYIVSHRDN